MKQVTYTINENTPLTADVYRMALAGDTSAITAPGQFINIALDGLFLRRPISVCDWDEKSLTIIYKVVGKGTAQMSEMKPGAALDCLSGLGNGYDLAACPDKVLLVGGGVGVPPLYGLARRLIAAGKRPSVILGFNTASEIFYDMAFAALGAPVTVTTADGTAGTHGFVTDAIPAGRRRPPSEAADTRDGFARPLTGQAPYVTDAFPAGRRRPPSEAADTRDGFARPLTGQAPYVCACGPEPMLKAVYQRASGGQFSFEARMGCGFGACMGCSCQTVAGPKRICKEGPVLKYEEILWQQDEPVRSEK